MKEMLDKVLSFYRINPGAAVATLGNGLINTTWKVTSSAENYVLQKINDQVFKQPADIADNIEALDIFLKKNHPDYFFVAPVKTKNGESLVHLPGEGYFRLFPFVKNSVTHTVASNADHAFEAAYQFGLFTKQLGKFPAQRLKITLPDFHDLMVRFEQFNAALYHGNPNRITESKNEIKYLVSQNRILGTYLEIKNSGKFLARVTHHDTKISNVLFDKKNKGIAVIDLDTVMPGYYISDVGDMMRTYLSPASEEETDFTKIEIRQDFFEGIAEGYLKAMADELTEAEIKKFAYSGIFLVYMQAVRFLTDYLNDDAYYGAAYDKHNYTRARNQIVLLKSLLEIEAKLNEIVSRVSKKYLHHTWI